MKQNKPKTFAAKHSNTTVDPAVVQEIKKHADQNKITCAAAHKIADNLGQAPANIGKQLDLMECKLSKCQMGLFGYKNKNKRFNPDISIPDDLNDRLEAAVKDQRISCHACWQIAKVLNISRMDIGSACEKKGLRIKPCQLGAF